MKCRDLLSCFGSVIDNANPQGHGQDCRGLIWAEVRTLRRVQGVRIADAFLLPGSVTRSTGNPLRDTLALSSFPCIDNTYSTVTALRLHSAKTAGIQFYGQL